MSEYTSNLNLEKPNENEFFNINIFNSNSDKIDNAVIQMQKKNSVIYDSTDGISSINTDTRIYSTFKVFVRSADGKIYFSEVITGKNVISSDIVISVSENSISVSGVGFLIVKVIGVS